MIICMPSPKSEPMGVVKFHTREDCFTWPIVAARVCYSSSGDKTQMSAVMHWCADHPSGVSRDCFAWIKDVQLNAGKAKLSTDDLDGGNAALYYGDFPELHSVSVRFVQDRINVAMVLIRQDGSASDQRCCIDLDHWTDTQPNELRFP
ncbi:MAG TPA: hypothetical protein DDZ51_28685 [Planctomycetaceae bacterium]|nr:hypothetical protein [Planctomycetaceae bacterium]